MNIWGLESWLHWGHVRDHTIEKVYHYDKHDRMLKNQEKYASASNLISDFLSITYNFHLKVSHLLVGNFSIRKSGFMWLQEGCKASYKGVAL